jgi:hypothetical protein
MMINFKDKYFDTINLVHNADFEVMISHNLCWVPVNVLGFTEYTNYDVSEFLNCAPLEKSLIIKNVYEAIQLLQISGFQDKDDVIKKAFNGNLWEHHKPGYHAVLSNYGCCSSVASWLNYLINGKYPETGYIGFFRPDVSGHVINYIYKNNWYYIIDISAMENNFIMDCCKETGNRLDLLKAKYITGCCYKTTDVSYFVKFHSRIQKYHNFEFLYYKVPSVPYLPPCSGKIENNIVEMIVSDKVELLNDVQSIHVKTETEPNYCPNWNIYNENAESTTPP